MYSSENPGKQATEIRQASLIDAAIQLAAQRSPAAITTGDLAMAVGITQGAMFRHFDSKQSLWLAVLCWVHDTLLSRLQEAAELNEGKPLEALRAVFMAHVEFVLAHPGVPRILFHELQQPEDSPHKAEVRALMQAYRALLMRLLTSAEYSNLIAIDIDKESASVLFLGSVQGLVMQALMAGDVSVMCQQAAAVFAIYQRGLQHATPHSTQGIP